MSTRVKSRRVALRPVVAEIRKVEDSTQFGNNSRPKLVAETGDSASNLSESREHTLRKHHFRWVALLCTAESVRVGIFPRWLVSRKLCRFPFLIVDENKEDRVFARLIDCSMKTRCVELKNSAREY